MPMRYQLATPMRLNQSGMKPCAKGLGSAAFAAAGPAAGAGPASDEDASARLVKNFTAAP